MSDPMQVPSRQDANHASLSPVGSPSRNFLVPSPIITKRTRTRSMGELAMEHPIEHGIVKHFCRVKGHGFISRENGEDLFVHVSDIEGEYVPRIGDEVSFRKIPIPPKMEKFQAVHVQIVNFTPEVHQRWENPITEEEGAAARQASPSH